MNSKINYQPGRLQQQPRRPVDREQQQSSGFGELQPRHPAGPSPVSSSIPKSAGRMRAVRNGFPGMDTKA